jgi:hypothetical protein
VIADPHLVEKIVNEAVSRYGTGSRHGDWTISQDQWREIVRFVLETEADIKERS